MSALWAVALIMFASGVAKLRSGEDVAETFTRLKVPRPVAARGLAAAFPWLELLLGVALVQPFTVLRPLVGLAAVALFAAFLVLVVRAKGDGVSCGCFGEASAAPISGWTVSRNVIFLVLAVLALVEGVVTLTTHGAAVDWLPLDAFGAGAWAWALLVALLLAVAALLVGRESVPPAPAAEEGLARPAVGAPVSGGAAEGSADDDEPERVVFPDAVVRHDHSYVGLHAFVREGAVVALRLSPGCGSCSSVIERLDEFRDALGPVRVRILMPLYQPEGAAQAYLGAIPQDLVTFDPGANAAQAVGLTTFPAAVLLGTDGLTAGGPVYGADAVLEFLEEIRDIMATELPAAQAAAVGTEPEA